MVDISRVESMHYLPICNFFHIQSFTSHLSSLNLGLSKNITANNKEEQTILIKAHLILHIIIALLGFL